MAAVRRRLSSKGPARPAPLASPSDAQLQHAIADLLKDRDLASLSLRTLRRELEVHFHLGEAELDIRREKIASLAQERVQEVTDANAAAEAACIVASEAETAARRLGRQQSKERRRRLRRIKKGKGKTKGKLKVRNAKEKGGIRGKGLGRLARRCLTRKGSLDATSTKEKPVGYLAYFLEQRKALLEEIRTSLPEGGKPNTCQIGKIAGERWRAMSAEERAQYGHRHAAKISPDISPSASASTTKVDLPCVKRTKVEGCQTDRGLAQDAKSTVSGAGNAQDNTQSSQPMTRAEFMALEKRLQLLLVDPAANASSQSSSSSPLAQIELVPRLFKTGSAGWFYGGKVPILVGERTVTVLATLNFVVLGSKTWADGEANEAENVASSAVLANSLLSGANLTPSSSVEEGLLEAPTFPLIEAFAAAFDPEKPTKASKHINLSSEDMDVCTSPAHMSLAVDGDLTSVAITSPHTCLDHAQELDRPMDTPPKQKKKEIETGLEEAEKEVNKSTKTADRCEHGCKEHEEEWSLRRDSMWSDEVVRDEDMLGNRASDVQTECAEKERNSGSFIGLAIAELQPAENAGDWGGELQSRKCRHVDLQDATDQEQSVMADVATAVENDSPTSVDVGN